MVGPPGKIQPQDDDAVRALREVPGNWDVENDEEMVKFLSEHVVQENEKLGNVKQYVEAVAVSSSWVSGFKFLLWNEDLWNVIVCTFSVIESHQVQIKNMTLDILVNTDKITL